MGAGAGARGGAEADAVAMANGLIPSQEHRPNSGRGGSASGFRGTPRGTGAGEVKATEPRDGEGGGGARGKPEGTKTVPAAATAAGGAGESSRSGGYGAGGAGAGARVGGVAGDPAYRSGGSENEGSARKSKPGAVSADAGAADAAVGAPGSTGKSNGAVLRPERAKPTRSPPLPSSRSPLTPPPGADTVSESAALLAAPIGWFASEKHSQKQKQGHLVAAARSALLARMAGGGRKGAVACSERERAGGGDGGGGAAGQESKPEAMDVDIAEGGRRADGPSPGPKAESKGEKIEQDEEEKEGRKKEEEEEEEQKEERKGRKEQQEQPQEEEEEEQFVAVEANKRQCPDHALPVARTFFDYGEASKLEMRMLPEFFTGRSPSKTPEVRNDEVGSALEPCLPPLTPAIIIVVGGGGVVVVVVVVVVVGNMRVKIRLRVTETWSVILPNTP